MFKKLAVMVTSPVLIVTVLLVCCGNNYGDIHPFRRVESYNGSVGDPVERRLLPAPEMVLNVLNMADNIDDYSPYELSSEEKKLFMEYYGLLPEKLKSVIAEKVVGIYFINNFLVGGMVVPIFDRRRARYMVMFFNPEILRQSMTEWINFRDNSAFAEDHGGITIKVECSGEYYALLAILLHEASHIYDYYNRLTPFIEKYMKDGNAPSGTEFVKDVWGDFDRQAGDYDFMGGRRLSFYGLGQKTDMSGAKDIYADLRNTPFSSLYATKSWAEDFAEAFTWYYLKMRFDIDYITTLLEDGEAILTYDPNESESVRKRYGMLERIAE